MSYNIKAMDEKQRSAAYKEIASAMGDDGFFTKKELNHLPEILSDGEHLVAYASGMMDSKTWLIALTNRRVLLLDKGMLYGLRQTEFLLSNITAVSYEKALLFGTVTIQVSSSNHVVEKIPKIAAERFALAIRSEISASNQPAATVTADDSCVVSRLERLEGLLNRGVINNEEFESQKTKILAS